MFRLLVALFALVGCIVWLLARKRRPTKRDLYFLAIWLGSPLAVMKLIWGGALLPFVHVPFVLLHSWRARKRSTKELLRASWKVPFLLAAWGLAFGLAWLVQIAASAGGGVPTLGELFNGYALGLLGIIVGSCFGAMAIPFAIAWLVLASVARRWPEGERAVGTAAS